MAQAKRPRDLGLGESPGFPTSSFKPPPPAASKKIRKLPQTHLPHPSATQIFKVFILLFFLVISLLTIKNLPNLKISSPFSSSALSLTCASPFSYIRHSYRFLSQADCQTLRCTYDGITKEGDLYWCSQQTQEAPVSCSNHTSGQYTCATSVGTCEVVRLTTDNNCDSAITYDCSGCQTTSRPNLLTPIPPPALTLPPSPKFSLSFPKSLSDLPVLFNQAISFISVGLSSLQGNH